MNKLLTCALPIQTNFVVEVAVRDNAIDMGMFSLNVFFDEEELKMLIRGICEEVEKLD